MFTGIIQGLGRLKSINSSGGEATLTIEASFDWSPALVIGESIAVSGVCLTVTEGKARQFSALASAETLERTVLGALTIGSTVNLERALLPSDRLGGHMVTGHVDGLATVNLVKRVGQSLVMGLEVTPPLKPYIVEKGSVALDGVSLTVNQITDNGFTINLIPHSADVTTLGSKKPGDKINLETDIIGKYVVSYLKNTNAQAGGIDKTFLARHGFL